MVLVTGADGFVGSALCKELRQRGTGVVGAVRKGAKAGQVAVGNLDGATDWARALDGCGVVIHLAARVHVMSDQDADPLLAYREVNVQATLNLARQAILAGVTRFVFVSSVKVNGECTTGRAFAASDPPAPCDPYGQSKLEAELGLLELARNTPLEVVIVRPPLVYGPGVKANFLSLMRLVQRGLPLPFASIRNQRSMVALDNLVDLLIVCSTHPNASGGTFMVSDGRDIALGELIRMIGMAMGKRSMLFPVPAGLIRGAAMLVGKAAVADRVVGSLQVDIAETKERLGWAPVLTPQAAIDGAVEHFLAQARDKGQAN